jgi:hypothetical protein
LTVAQVHGVERGLSRSAARAGLVADDAVMDTGTWVPLVTAAAGLAAGLATGLATTILARRWTAEDRAAQWQREDALRWHADRLQAYTRLIAALYAWDAEARRVQDRRPWAEGAEEPPPFDADQWERHARAANELVMLVFLMAPEKVRDLARRCYVAYARLGDRLAGQYAHPAAARSAGDTASRATRGLVEAMRADLGLGGEQPEPPQAGRPAE